MVAEKISQDGGELSYMETFKDVTDAEWAEVHERFSDIYKEEPGIARALVERLRAEKRGDVVTDS